MTPDSTDEPQGAPVNSGRRGKRKRANGEGSIWLRKDGRYGYAGGWLGRGLARWRFLTVGPGACLPPVSRSAVPPR
jgi:hypothetical protein